MYYSAIYEMQFFYPQFWGISAGHGWQHKHRHSALTVSQLIIKYPLGQKSIPLSLLVSYLYHNGSAFFPFLSMVTNSFNLSRLA